MKSIILLACVFVTATIAGPVPAEPVKLIRSEFEQKPDGGYNLSYESDDGIVKQETGEVKEAFDEENKPHLVVAVRGFFSYPKPDGSGVEKVTYVADESGFHAEGDSIPKNPYGVFGEIIYA